MGAFLASHNILESLQIPMGHSQYISYCPNAIQLFLLVDSELEE